MGTFHHQYAIQASLIGFGSQGQYPCVGLHRDHEEDGMWYILCYEAVVFKLRVMNPKWVAILMQVGHKAQTLEMGQESLVLPLPQCWEKKEERVKVLYYILLPHLPRIPIHFLRLSSLSQHRSKHNFPRITQIDTQVHWNHWVKKALLRTAVLETSSAGDN